MAWESVSKVVGHVSYGAGWTSRPCAAITKQGVTFNRQFVEVFNCKQGKYIRILIDREHRKIGFKLVPEGDCLAQAFKLQGTDTNKKTTEGIAQAWLVCKLIAKVFADCRGYAFRAMMNPGEHVIEVSLDPNNKA